MKQWLAENANVSDTAIWMSSIFYNIESWLDLSLVRSQSSDTDTEANQCCSLTRRIKKLYALCSALED
jgi:hypothetical protein